MAKLIITLLLVPLVIPTSGQPPCLDLQIANLTSLTDANNGGYNNNYTFDLKVSGGSTGWKAEIGDTILVGTYGINVKVGPFKIEDSPLFLLVYDSVNQICANYQTVPAPTCQNCTDTITTVCSGEVVELKAITRNSGVYGNYTSFQWYKNDVPIIDAVDTTYMATSSGVYSVRGYNDYLNANSTCSNKPICKFTIVKQAAQIAEDDLIHNSCPGLALEGNVAVNDTKSFDAKYALIAPTSHGLLVFDSTGLFSFSPSSANCLIDQFTYQLCNTGNSCCDTATVTLNLLDTIQPILVNIPTNDTLHCDEQLPPLPLISAIDNCPGIGINVEESSTKGEDGCSLYDYALTRTWTASDLCGNSISDKQIIQIEDVIAPTIYRIYTLPNGKKMVAGVMEQVGQYWKTISLPIDFPTTPLVFTQVITKHENTPVTSMVRNVSTTQFELQLKEEYKSGRKRLREDVAWIAVETDNELVTAENRMDLIDQKGNVFGETGSIAVSKNWTTFTTNHTYYNPVVVTDLPQDLDENLGVVRVQNVNANSFDIRYEEWETGTDNHHFESISFRVIEGSLPLDASRICEYGTNGLVIGTDIIAVDNCDTQVDLQYETTTIISNHTKQIIQTWYVEDECGNATGLSQIVPCQGLGLRLRAALQGAMIDNGSTNLMRDNLRKKKLLPLTEPYSNLSQFEHIGGGGEVCNIELLNITGSKAVVDWVFIELKEAENRDRVVATQSALLLRDGQVITAEGDSTLYFENLPPDNYFIALRHRNHLKVETLYPYLLTEANIPLIDFTNQFLPTLGQQAFFDSEGINTLWSGDLNGDEKTIYQGPNNDVFYMFLQVVLDSVNQNYLTNFINRGYTNNDFNLDGITIYQGPNNDRSSLLFNTILQHPNNTIKASNYVLSTNATALDNLENCQIDKTLPNCDYDGDGKTNRVDADDDNDGVTDGNDQAPYNFNSDSDGDGISDVVEYINATNPLNACDPFQDHATCQATDLDGDGKYGNYPPNHNLYDADDQNACLPNPTVSNCGCEDEDSDGYIFVCHTTESEQYQTLKIPLVQWQLRQLIGDKCGACPD